MRELSRSELQFIGGASANECANSIKEGGAVGFGIGATFGAIGGIGGAILGGLVGALIGGAEAIRSTPACHPKSQ